MCVGCKQITLACARSASATLGLPPLTAEASLPHQEGDVQDPCLSCRQFSTTLSLLHAEAEAMGICCQEAEGDLNGGKSHRKMFGALYTRWALQPAVATGEWRLLQ